MTAAMATLRQELRLLRREKLAFGAPILFVLLLVAAGFNGRALIGLQTQTGAQLVEEAGTIKRALASQAEKGVASARDPGALGLSVLNEPVAMPPAALAPLAIGQADLLPSYYEVTARGAHTLFGLPEIDNPLRLSIGNFDAAFVIVWLLPLIVIALSFNLLSGERERGTLSVAAAAGASVSSFVLRKVSARALIVLVSVVVGVLAAALAAGVSLGEREGLVGVLLWLLTATLYATFWFALALLVNSGTQPSDRNATVLAAAWLGWVILAPTLTNLAATTVFAAPSRVELTTELREATEEADRRSAATRDQYFFDHPEMRGGEMDMTAYYDSVAAAEADVERAVLPLMARFDRQAERQQSLVEALQFLSPGTLTYQLLTALSGSDGRRHRLMRAQALEFHGDWVRFFGERRERRAALTAADYARLPTFSFSPTPLAAEIRRSVLPLLVLAAAAGGVLGLALRRLRRLSVV